MDELFKYMDINNDKTISIRELVIACSPDIDNNKIYDDRELSIGSKTVRIWLASILIYKREIIVDGLIDKKEMIDLFSRISWPVFYKKGEEDVIKEEYTELFIEVDNILKEGLKQS